MEWIHRQTPVAAAKNLNHQDFSVTLGTVCIQLAVGNIEHLRQISVKFWLSHVRLGVGCGVIV